MMKYWILSLIFVMTFFTSVRAEGDYFSPLWAGTSARSISIGQVEGFGSDAYTIFENAAGMYRIEKLSASMFYTKFLGEVQYVNLAIAFRLPRGMLGFGYMNAGVSGIPKTQEVIVDDNDSFFRQVGAFSYNNNIYKLSYQYSQNEWLHFGTSFSMMTEDIDTVHGSGYNFDVGALFTFNRWEFSIGVKNILSSLKMEYKDSSDPDYSAEQDLPLESAYGFKYTRGDFIYYGQLKVMGSDKDFVKNGGITWQPAFFNLFRFSAGYKEFPVVQLVDGVVSKKTFSNFTFGMGLDLRTLSFDYAYESSEHPSFSGKHYFSAAYHF